MWIACFHNKKNDFIMEYTSNPLTWEKALNWILWDLQYQGYDWISYYLVEVTENELENLIETTYPA